MLVRKIQIDNFENVGHFDASFDPRLAFLPPESAGTVVKAIGTSLKCRFLTGEVKANADTVIKAEIETGGEAFFITATPSPETNGFTCSVRTEDGKSRTGFYDAIRQCEEEERLSRFVFDKNDRYSYRFKRYKDIERYYTPGRFSELTDGIGNTKLFRSCLRDHIKTYIPQTPAFNKDCRIVLRDTGQFAIESVEPGALNDRQEALFEYLCFLEVNRFWKSVQEVRDFHHAPWPLFITGLPELAAGTRDATAYLQKALSLERQIFVCGPTF